MAMVEVVEVMYLWVCFLIGRRRWLRKAGKVVGAFTVIVSKYATTPHTSQRIHKPGVKKCLKQVQLGVNVV